ncbi:MAG: septation protein A [Alphaproteobacteria bacterium]|jgi:intracellular septation protein|nr:septation protein A [Alphaproteobacteria bacterium]|tara:strand:- start:402 stop:944 length:543 start_codon:yes stop_codon:yes gene_type:complete
MKPLIKLITEVGPLAVFFIGNSKFGIFPATAAFMVATAIAIPISWKIEGKLPIMPIIIGVFVVFFGSLTLIFQDPTFIKIKPTIVNLVFAAGLIISRTFFQKNVLKIIFNKAFNLTERGWRVLNIRWSFFFIFLAILNEIVWRNYSTEIWISFKLWGIMPLTIVWTLAQMPLVSKETIKK